MSTCTSSFFSRCACYHGHSRWVRNHIRYITSICVMFCEHMCSSTCLIRQTLPPTLCDTAFTDRHTDTKNRKSSNSSSFDWKLVKARPRVEGSFQIFPNKWPIFLFVCFSCACLMSPLSLGTKPNQAHYTVKKKPVDFTVKCLATICQGI